MIRQLETQRVLHIVRESTATVFTVVLDPNVYRVVFGPAGKSEVLAQTNRQMQELLEGNCKSISREVKGDQVTAIVVEPVDGKVVELHPTCLSAADAYEAHIRKTGTPVEVGNKQSA